MEDFRGVVLDIYEVVLGENSRGIEKSQFLVIRLFWGRLFLNKKNVILFCSYVVELRKYIIQGGIVRVF